MRCKCRPGRLPSGKIQPLPHQILQAVHPARSQRPTGSGCDVWSENEHAITQACYVLGMTLNCIRTE